MLNSNGGADGAIIKHIGSNANIKTLTNTIGATIENIDGGTITTLTNVGTVTINNGANITTLNANGGVINLSGGTIETMVYKGNQPTTLNFGSATINGATTNDSGATLNISGTLTTTTLTNSGETINFTVTDNATGKLVGDLANTSGTVNVDITGATLVLGKEYNIITGTVSGDTSGFGIKSANDKYLKATYSTDFKSVIIDKSQAFEEMQAQLGENKGTIAEKLMMDNVNIDASSVVADTDNSIKEGYISTPKHIISNFKSNTLNNIPLGMGVGAKFASADKLKFKRTASANIVRSDFGYGLNSAVSEPQIEFFAMPFVGELRGKGVNGTVGGAGVGVGYLSEIFALQGHFNYAYAESSQGFATQRDDLSAYLFQVGLLGQLFFADLVEIDINANYLLGKFTLDNV